MGGEDSLGSSRALLVYQQRGNFVGQAVVHQQLDSFCGSKLSEGEGGCSGLCRLSSVLVIGGYRATTRACGLRACVLGVGQVALTECVVNQSVNV